MSRFHSYIRTAQQLIAHYDGSLPFAHFAKAFFAKEKKYGSTDRRQISALCYHYFRAAKTLTEMHEEDKFVAATFLCEEKPTKLLEVVKPEWNAAVDKPVAEKIALLESAFNREGLFPFKAELSNQIDKDTFAVSFLQQPDLFLRVRPGYENAVPQQLAKANIPYQSLNNHCLRLPNGSKIDELLRLNKEVVVQDYSSQQTGTVMQQFALQHLPEITSWDCCAASGGKSLMLYDLRPDAQLTVSDIRQSIIHNLQQRFKEAGIQHYQSFVADASKGVLPLAGKKFNCIIADVPCTGSGTWARTPEQLYYFDKAKIDTYAQLQLSISKNVLPFLTKGGYFIYITCSVFEKENEANVQQLLEQPGMKLVHMQYVQGYSLKADTLFIAVLHKK